MRAKILLAGFGLGCALFAHPVMAGSVNSSVSLHAGTTAAVPGKAVPIALKVVIPDGWYTYAQDPGDAGMPPSIKLVQPKGGHLGAWRFPPHATFSDEAGTYYGYKHNVVLLSEIRLPATYEGETVDIRLDAVWMICKDVCLPFRKQVTLTLPVVQAGEAKPSAGWHKVLKSGGWDVEDNKTKQEPEKEAT